MATTYQTNIQISHLAVLQATDAVLYPKVAKSYSWSSGTGASQSDLVYIQYEGTIPSSGSPVTLDLYAGGLTTPTADATFLEVTAVTVANDSATDTITVGGGANDLAGFGGQSIPPGGIFCVACHTNPAWAIGSSADSITLTAGSGTDVPYRIIVSGRSA